MDPDRQRRFIAVYEKLLNSLPANEMVMFADAVHPTYGAQPVGCWAPKGVAIAVEQTTGREHVNIQGAIDLHTGTTCVLEVPSVDATSTIARACKPSRRAFRPSAGSTSCSTMRAAITPSW